MLEIDYTFSSFDNWMSWSNENKIFCDGQRIFDVGERIRNRGFTEPMTQLPVKAADILPDATGKLREGLIAFSKNSRARAVMRLIERQLEGLDRISVSIYAPEAVTALAMCLRGFFPRFLGSEYASTDARRDSLYPIPHEDLTCLTLRSDAFDLVTTNEVLEHVPNIDAALSEIFRVLKPGGWHIGTHPFLFMNQNGVVRAELIHGRVTLNTEPEYHGNPVGEPSLVFEIPGWSILDRARKIGFSIAHMRFVASETYGYLTENMGVFVLCCQK